MRASRSGKSSCAATPTVKLLRRDGRPAHGYHGSREHGNERNAGGLHRSGLVRAGTGAGDAHWRDVHMLSAERSKGERGATLWLCALPASFVKNRKELITDHLGRKHRSGPPLHGRIALEAPTAEPPGLQAQACTMLCAHFAGARGRRGPKPRPDVQHTPRGAAHAERSACASRGQTAAARCRPDRPARPRGGGGGRA